MFRTILNTTLYAILNKFNPDEIDKLASSLKENEAKIPGSLNALFTSLNKIRESMIEWNYWFKSWIKRKKINLTLERGNIPNITWKKNLMMP